MKKLIFTLTLVLTGLTATSQDIPFAFTDKDGNEIVDGAVINVTDFIQEEDPGTGEVYTYMTSGLMIKNISQNNSALRLNINLTRMDNGGGQICFPINCMPLPEIGEYTTNSDNMTTGEIRDLQMEWFADEQGICEAQIQIELMAQFGLNYIHVGFGPTVTVRFNYGMPVSIDGDIDGNNIIDVEDVNAAINIVLKIKTIDDYSGNGDMDHNNIIDIEDVNAIINLILKQ